MIKDADFNPLELHSRQRREASEPTIADMFVRYAPEVTICLVEFYEIKWHFSQILVQYVQYL